MPVPEHALPPRHRSSDGLLGGRWPPSYVHPLDLTPTSSPTDPCDIQTPNQGDPLPIGKGSWFLGRVRQDDTSGSVGPLVGSSTGSHTRLTRHRCLVGPGTSQWAMPAHIIKMPATGLACLTVAAVPKSDTVTGVLGWVPSLVVAAVAGCSQTGPPARLVSGLGLRLWP